jgi:hypothetical protein
MMEIKLQILKLLKSKVLTANIIMTSHESNLKLYFFFLFSISSFGQSPVISQYEKADIEYKGNHYSEILGVNKNETVILKIETNKFR